MVPTLGAWHQFKQHVFQNNMQPELFQMLHISTYSTILQLSYHYMATKLVVLYQNIDIPHERMCVLYLQIGSIQFIGPIKKTFFSKYQFQPSFPISTIPCVHENTNLSHFRSILKLLYGRNADKLYCSNSRFRL